MRTYLLLFFQCQTYKCSVATYTLLYGSRGKTLWVAECVFHSFFSFSFFHFFLSTPFFFRSFSSFAFLPLLNELNIVADTICLGIFFLSFLCSYIGLVSVASSAFYPRALVAWLGWHFAIFYFFLSFCCAFAIQAIVIR